MSGTGQVLRDARHAAGIPLEQAAWATRLREDYLDALERDDVDPLGLEPAYVRGTVRTYAEYLGLDGAALVARHRDGQASASGRPRRRSRRRAPRAFAALLGVVVVAVTAFALGDASARGRLPWSLDGRFGWPPGGTDTADADADAEPADRPAAGGSTASEPEATQVAGDDEEVLSAPSEGPLRLKMEFLDEVWVRGETDGAPAFEGIYELGQVERLRADERIDLRLGVGGMVEFTLNGAWYGPLGRGASGPIDLRCDAAGGCRVLG